MEDLTKLSWDGADKVENLAAGLHERVQEEIDKILQEQLEKLGFDCTDIEQIKRVLYPDDPNTLAVYQYKGKTILAVRIGPNGMSITFDVPELETQKGEVQ